MPEASTDESADGAPTSAVSPPTNPGRFAEVYIERLEVHGFRGIDECKLELEPDLTLLAGHNNAGKSRILSALNLALGGRRADPDDFTVGQELEPYIDVVLAPRLSGGDPADESFEDNVGRKLGTGVQTLQEEPLRERFAWRTYVRRSAEGLGAFAETRLLTFDVTNRRWTQRTDARALNADQRSLFAAELIDTKRDMVEELSRRGSPIRKILSDLEFTESNRQEIEDGLTALGASIISGSNTLMSLREALDGLHRLIGSMGAPHLNPLPMTLDELARSVSVDLDTGSGALPIRMHGSGSRSLASLQVQGVLYDRRLGKDGSALAPHPVSLVEEPEAHLHPQAALELCELLVSLRGQKVVSTHSAQLVTAVPPRSIRLLRKQTAGLRIIDLGPAATAADAPHRALRPDLHTAEMETLKRLVERPFGEMVFATAVIIGDGATERAFLPVVVRYALQHRAHGICVVDPESLASPVATAAVKFATLTETPWYVFADSDPSGKAAATTLLHDQGDSDPSRLIWIENTGGTKSTDGAFESMMTTFDSELCRAACKDVRSDISDSMPLHKALKKVKGSVGVSLASRLIAEYPDIADWPEPLRILIERLQQEL
ncbi:AAA family ATPase [Gordonia sp. NPDC127522]|uniref:AAA family ATPase n=1 Tax=Gordonia sp. NPDC127522 TaxID=3345390 RepID=UPI00363689C1